MEIMQRVVEATVDGSNDNLLIELSRVGVERFTVTNTLGNQLQIVLEGRPWKRCHISRERKLWRHLLKGMIRNDVCTSFLWRRVFAEEDIAVASPRAREELKFMHGLMQAGGVYVLCSDKMSSINNV
jgi:hypothetical protein